jgi:hypothetical protein
MGPWAKELGSWVRTQRDKYKKGKISSDRISKLKSLQFEWVLYQSSKKKDTTKADGKWHQQYLKLLDLHQGHGHCIVTSFYDSDKTVGWWVLGKQRLTDAENRLAEDRKHLLDVLGFI